MKNYRKLLSEWSEARRNRDKCCVQCKTTKALVAHHIKEKSQYPDLVFDLDNGITLCSNCHIEHHRKNPSSKHSIANKQKRLEKKNEIKNLKNEVISLNKEKSKLISIISEMQKNHAMQLSEYEIAYEKMIGKKFAFFDKFSNKQ